ncbi:TIGR03557 family F420-dependent LLM class oxidoreductase [Actinokineospora enzanensis]|uniref:TIGR03557 family F420-dependent LLM class oxidoreductase n=1 Tax=Actinokineospora enzanensis TaxID=155975 RepID=UPI000524766B
MTEQAGPSALVRHAAGAEQAGFDFEVISDHYSPWLSEQGHAPNAWAVLGAVTQVTGRVELMTYVTCPTMRYHPVLVAQQAATVQSLSHNRFTLGVGAGENLNEHVLGRGWPPVNLRHDMLVEAVDIIAALFDGGHVDYVGEHFQTDSAKLWDLPDTRVPIAAAVSGDRSVGRLAPLADHMIAVDPDAGLCRAWDGVARAESRKIGQFPISWDTDRDAAVARAHDQFRWALGGWKVNAELPGPSAFAAATRFVRPDDVAAHIPCGADVDAVVQAAAAYWEAGFTDLALIQVGGTHQDHFLAAARQELLPALRAAAPN